MAPPSLTTLPLEMLTLVASHLSTPDLGALRLSCRTIEQLLFDNFAKEFFSKKQFMLTHPSLQILVDISKHSGLCKHLKHVIITTETYSKDDLRRIAPQSEAYRRYIRGYEEQSLLMTTGLDCDMLSEAFRNLYNLETVEMRDYISDHRRPRDGDALWKSAGWRAIFEQIGLELKPANPLYAYAMMTPEGFFRKLLVSLGKAGRSIPTLQTLLHTRHGALPDSAFLLPDYQLPSVEPVLRDLKTLLLTVNSMDALGDGEYLQHLLGRTKGLRHLRLNFQASGRSLDKNKNFLRWLAHKPGILGSPGNTLNVPIFLPIQLPTFAGAAAPTTTISSVRSPPYPTFPFLSRLDLGFTNIECSILLDVVKHFSPTLTGLSLWRITALGLLGVVAQPPYDRSMNLWSAFFDAMASIAGLNLQYLMLGQLARKDSGPSFQGGGWHKVDFKPAEAVGTSMDSDDEDEPMNDEDGMTYESRIELRGHDTMVKLKGLSRRVHVQWPKPPPPPPSSSDGEEDDDHVIEISDGDSDSSSEA